MFVNIIHCQLVLDVFWTCAVCLLLSKMSCHCRYQFCAVWSLSPFSQEKQSCQGSSQRRILGRAMVQCLLLANPNFVMMVFFRQFTNFVLQN